STVPWLLRTAALHESSLAQVIVRNRLHVVACASAGAWAWGSLLRCTPSAIELVVIAAVVLCTYQWNRLTDQREDAINCPDELSIALGNRRAIRAGCALLLVTVAGISVLLLSPAKQALLALTVALAFCYGSPVRLKSIFLVKNVSSSAGWCLLTVFYPAAG